MPLILVVAPIATWFAAGVVALASAIATPAIIVIEVLIRKLEKHSGRRLTEEDRASLGRQNALLRERETAAVTIAENTLQNAVQAAEERDALMDYQRNAASLLLESTRQIAYAATTLAAVSTSNSHERDAAFNREMAHQVTQLADTVQGVPVSMTLLIQELKEKQDMIESLCLKIAALEEGSAAREATLLQIVTQVGKLTSGNQDQAATIEILQRQKAALLNNMKALTEELELLTSSSPIEHENLTSTTTTAAPTFFR